MSSPTVTATPALGNENNSEVEVKAPISWRNPVASLVLTILGALLIPFTTGVSVFSFAGATSWFTIPNLSVPARPALFILVFIAAALTALIWVRALQRKPASGWFLAGVGLAFILTFLIWVVADNPNAVMPVVRLLAGALALAVPLVFGSFSGLVCERSGIINIAIEGQLLAGAFLGAVVASMIGNPWVALIAGPVAGMMVATLLALFTIKYRVDHIIVGVVLNMLVLGLTTFLYSSVLSSNEGFYNKAMPLPKLKIPVLADIPVLGPVFFNQSILIYLMYGIAIALQFLVFNSRWGLRMRAVGEHPKAADTVGIKVIYTRWMNTLIGGALAGLGGAFFTVGAGMPFSKNMAAGNGFIALAAMILGRWNPKGALAAAALFGFATNLGFIMQTVGSPVPFEFLLMIPYLVTILAVAGFVGRVRAPAAEGKPYP
ncbi:MAG: ABC transporter permease [Actinomycetaceae bacterium]|nr:ABC transporter permease [Actinomycetaceae bacterium]